ncbi:MAG: RluA family pseudouridine synthase [Polyangiaceae bacterium]|nr:RluA family pseudouridine synthase [Polyangiaceae bacterium]
MRFTLPAEECGVRLDKILCARIDGLGRAAVKRLFADGRVRLVPDGAAPRRAVKGDVGAEGLVVEVEVPSGDTSAVADPLAPLTVVLETDRIVVLEKPAGQATAPLAPGETGALANALVARYPEVRSCGFSPREPGLCHRLDTDTSGLVLAARTPAAFQALTTALREGRLDKRYFLLVKAADLPETGTIDIPLAPHPKDRRRVLACTHPRDVARNDPRPAVTTYEVVREHAGIALVEARAPRAMRHQIRAHFAAIEHPLLGDTLYGGETVPGLGRHALHAHAITWGGDPSVPAFAVRSELPEELARLVPVPDGG